MSHTTGGWSIPFNMVTSGALIGNFRYSTGTFSSTGGDITGSGTVSFTATTPIDFGGRTINNLSIVNTAAANYTLASNLVVGNNFISNTSTSLTRATFLSNSVGTQRKLTINSATYQDIGFTNFTDIDASDGATIWVWRPTLSNTKNINTITYPKSISKTYIK